MDFVSPARLFGQAVLACLPRARRDFCPGEFDAMGIVDEAIEDGVGVAGVSYRLMPAIHGKLGRDDRGAASVSLLRGFRGGRGGR